jgi:hypothetical protein
MIKRLIILFILVAPISAQSQSQAVREVFDKLPSANKYFFYPSTLRALSGENQQFLEFVKDVENIKLMMVNDKEENANLLLDLEYIEDELVSEGFAEIISLKEGDAKVMVLEYEGTTVALLNAKNDLSIVELVGTLNLAAGLKMFQEGELPINQFKSFWETEKPKKKSKEDAKQNKKN